MSHGVNSILYITTKSVKKWMKQRQQSAFNKKKWWRGFFHWRRKVTKKSKYFAFINKLPMFVAFPTIMTELSMFVDFKRSDAINDNRFLWLVFSKFCFCIVKFYVVKILDWPNCWFCYVIIYQFMTKLPLYFLLQLWPNFACN